MEITKNDKKQKRKAFKTFKRKAIRPWAFFHGCFLF